jgi:hypothetical protein
VAEQQDFGGLGGVVAGEDGEPGQLLPEVWVPKSASALLRADPALP